MSFNDNADLDTSQVEGGGGGGGMFGGGMPGGGIAVGGGAGGILLLILYFVFGGLSDSGGGSSTSPGQLQQGQVQAGGSQAGDFSQCRTGADANRDAQCRVIGTVNSVQAYWATELPRHGTSVLPRQHRPLQRQHAVALRHGVQPGRPVLLPPGPQGLHRRQLLQRADLAASVPTTARSPRSTSSRTSTGTTSRTCSGSSTPAQSDPQGADSGAVRVELMADCLAGVWARHATETKDAQGDAFLKPLTQTDIASALSAASAVGDDRIQRAAQGRVNPGVVDARVERAAPEVVHDRLPERRPGLLRHAERGDALTDP